MSAGQILRIYLDPESRARAKAGSYNIMSKIASAFERCDYRVEFVKDTAAERAKSVTRRGYALFHMQDPFHSRSLCLRRAYYYPFWRIERSAKRWEWDIARARFDPSAVDRTAADDFAASLRKRILPNVQTVSKDGYVYVPLQGRLSEHRSFQTQSPMDMIHSVLAYVPSRDVVLGLHPKESYSPDELEGLKRLIDRTPRLTLSSAPMEKLLAGCDFVVTENSSVALGGYLLEKPAVLFASIDFHHIAANVGDLGAQAALEQAPGLAPDFAGFVHWFFTETAINGGAPDAEDQVLQAVRRHGWEL